jgi:hypothetical protein
MTNKKISTHTIFMGVELLLAVLTLIPMPTASKVSLLGYKALCSFSPISTIGLLALVGVHFYLQKRSSEKANRNDQTARQNASQDRVG